MDRNFIVMTRYLLTIILALSFVLCFSVKGCISNKEERRRLAGNQEVLMTGLNFYRTQDSLSVASVEKLTLSNREFARYCQELKRTIADLHLKIKRLQSVSETAAETGYLVKTVVRDSLRPGQKDTLHCMDYRNNYLRFSGCMENNHFSGIIQSRDTIIQVVHRVPRRFWFIRWGTKAIRQEVISRNPYTQITYARYIELK